MINIVHVTQVCNKNQFDITINDKPYATHYFQSYDTLIAFYSDRDCELYINLLAYNYSRTTMKHLLIWLNRHGFNYYDSKLLKKAIKKGLVKTFEEQVR